MTRTRNPGVNTDVPSSNCSDVNCPFHGSLKVRGKTFTGLVVSAKMQRSAVVQWEGRRFVPKYERYTKTRTKVAVHNPDCVNAAEGDKVKIVECKPLSKTKNYVIVEVVGKDELYELEKEALEEGKHKITQKEEANKAKAAAEQTAAESA